MSKVLIQRFLLSLLFLPLLTACGAILGQYEALDKSAAEHFNRPYGSPPQNFRAPKKARKAGLIKPLKVKARLFGTPHQTCAVGPKGFGLYCWGSTPYGEFGFKKKGGVRPTKIKGLPTNDPIVDMAFMLKGACVLLKSGYVMCWGDNALGTVGNQHQIYYSKPVYVQGLEGAVRLSSYLMANQVCAILHTGHLYCWGLSDLIKHYKVFNRGSRPFGPASEYIIHKGPIKGLSSHNTGSCFQTYRGKVRCVGRTVGYKVPDDKATRQASIDLPKPAKGLSVFNPISLACAVLKNHDLWCWNGCVSDFYCYGDPNKYMVFTPQKIEGIPKINSIDDVVRRYNSTCILGTNHEVYCWGHCREHNACNLPKSFKAPKLRGAPGIRGKRTIQSCLKMCSKENYEKNAVRCSLFCNLGLNYYFTYQRNIKKGEPVIPAKQVSLSKYKFKALNNHGGGFCGLSKDNEVYCWGMFVHNIVKRKKKSKKPLNILKISNGWWNE